MSVEPYEVVRVKRTAEIEEALLVPYEVWSSTDLSDRPVDLLTADDDTIRVIAKDFIGTYSQWQDSSPNPYPVRVFVVENPGGTPALFYPEG